MVSSAAKTVKSLDELEALLITAEDLMRRIHIAELAGASACIRDTLSEIRHARRLVHLRTE